MVTSFLFLKSQEIGAYSAVGRAPFDTPMESKTRRRGISEATCCPPSKKWNGAAERSGWASPGYNMDSIFSLWNILWIDSNYPCIIYNYIYSYIYMIYMVYMIWRSHKNQWLSHQIIDWWWMFHILAKGSSYGFRDLDPILGRNPPVLNQAWLAEKSLMNGGFQWKHHLYLYPYL